MEADVTARAPHQRYQERPTARSRAWTLGSVLVAVVANSHLQSTFYRTGRHPLSPSNTTLDSPKACSDDYALLIFAKHCPHRLRDLPDRGVALDSVENCRHQVCSRTSMFGDAIERGPPADRVAPLP